MVWTAGALNTFVDAPPPPPREAFFPSVVGRPLVKYERHDANPYQSKLVEREDMVYTRTMLDVDVQTCKVGGAMRASSAQQH